MNSINFDNQKKITSLMIAEKISFFSGRKFVTSAILGSIFVVSYVAYRCLKYLKQNIEKKSNIDKKNLPLNEGSYNVFNPSSSSDINGVAPDNLKNVSDKKESDKEEIDKEENNNKNDYKNSNIKNAETIESIENNKESIVSDNVEIGKEEKNNANNADNTNNTNNADDGNGDGVAPDNLKNVSDNEIDNEEIDNEEIDNEENNNSNNVSISNSMNNKDSNINNDIKNAETIENIENNKESIVYEFYGINDLKNLDEDSFKREVLRFYNAIVTINSKLSIQPNPFVKINHFLNQSLYEQEYQKNLNQLKTELNADSLDKEKTNFFLFEINKFTRMLFNHNGNIGYNTVLKIHYFFETLTNMEEECKLENSNRINQESLEKITNNKNQLEKKLYQSTISFGSDYSEWITPNLEQQILELIKNYDGTITQV